MLNLLITGKTDFTDDDLKIINKLGYATTIVGREDSEKILNPELFDVIICNWLFAKHNIENFTNLKAVQLLSAGLDRMPMDYASKHSIHVKSARGIYSIPIAEFTMMVVLDEYKHTDFFYDNQKECRWYKHRDLDELSDKTVCVFGTGSVGTEVAKRFSAFVNQVIGVGLYPENKLYFTEIVDMNHMEDALRKSDVVILTLPLTDNTYHLFDINVLKMMKNDAVLVNVARGALIDESSLRHVLESGRFRAVILDVFEEEPLNEDYWGWKSDRVRIIPHNSFVSKNNNERIKKHIMENLKNWYSEISGGK